MNTTYQFLLFIVFQTSGVFSVSLKSKRDINIDVYKKAIKFASKINPSTVTFHDIATLDGDHILALVFPREDIKKLTSARDHTMNVYFFVK